jgi:hydrogenase expression/formation protein HypE
MDNALILLGHGGGGRLTSELLAEVVLPELRNPLLDSLDDSVLLNIPEADIVFTTDSYVVDPLFFPGGNIGHLAACGTMNDLVMQGAEPRFLSLGLILKEGLPIGDLRTIIHSLAVSARDCGVRVVAGDTKVVERGRGSGVFINTAGIGVRLPGIDVSAGGAQPGDAVILTGTAGDHGIAIMSQREGLAFESEIRSDVAALWPMIRELLDACPDIHCLRDPTRGGVTGALCDIAAKSRVSIRIHEKRLPIDRQVDAACRLLGLDPLNVANEGKALVICPPEKAEAALATLQAQPLGRQATVIGEVTADKPGQVTLRTSIGGERILTPPTGEDLPRIC